MQLPSGEATVEERDRLLRVIAEAKGKNPIEARETQFKATNSLIDLANLLETLEEQRDWSRLITYGRVYFERTRDLPSCLVYVQALFETNHYPDIIRLLETESHWVHQSVDIQAFLAWSFYRVGDVKACRKALPKLKSARDFPGDRILEVSLAISVGDWASLATFVEEEWIKRGERTGEDLLRAGQLAHQIGSSRSKELIFEAASKAVDNPEILIGCYWAGVNAGWEDNITSTWLERGAASSNESGPVKKVSFKELLELQPSWHEQENQTWEQLLKGTLPMFAAGHLLNRSLFEMFLLPALSNAEQLDPRRRTVVYAFSGARNSVQEIARVVAMDPTALLTAGIMDAIDPILGSFEKIFIPHGTLGWLFEERQQIQFHQPSRIADAKEIKRLLETRVLHKFLSTVAPINDLALEIGEELASLFLEAESDFAEDRRQRLVVRSSPIHRISSLMEEEADLGKHVDYVCGCLDVIDAMALRGQLTQAEEQHARAFLRLREKPWPNPNAIEPGAVLYLDQLSVSYLQHLGLLARIQASGFTGFVPASLVLRDDNFLRL